MQEFGELEMANHRVTFDSMRLQTLYLVNIQMEKKHHITDVRKLMAFPWDSKEIKKQSVEEMKHILMGVARVQNKKVEAQNKNRKK